MKLLIAPIALLGLLALSACGGDSQAGSGSSALQTQVERQAASSDPYYTLCVKNDSSRTISSTGDGSPTRPEGFVVRPGENACTSTSPGTGELSQNMISDVGPAWTTRFTHTAPFWSGTVFKEVFTTCGQTWTTITSISTSLSCSGNPFRLTVNFDYKGAAAIANVTFADQ